MRSLLVAATLLTALPPYRLTALQCPDGTPPPCRSARSASAAPAPPNSVAVLFFENASRDSADAWLADGMTEELIVRLGQVESLQVKSRGIVQRYRGSADPSAAGRALNVAYVVSGSVRRNGGRVSVVAELARTSGGVRIWGDVFDRTPATVVGVETEIARAVATAIAGRLRPGEQTRLARRLTTDPAAYESYLRGNVHLAMRGTGNSLAIRAYQNAVRRDPSFANAWGRLAIAYNLTTSWAYDSTGISRDSLMARAVQAAQRALALDSSNANAWLAIGLTASRRGDLESAHRSMWRAFMLDSSDAETAHTLGVNRFRAMDLVNAERYLRRALELEPGRGVTRYWLAHVLYEQRRFPAAAAFADSLAAYPLILSGVDVQAWPRARNHARVGDRRALSELAQLQAAPGSFTHLAVEAMQAEVEALLGDTAGARNRLERALPADWKPETAEDTEAANVVLALVAAGQVDRAFHIVEQRSVSNRHSAWEVLRNPAFDPWRADPRVQRLIELVWPR